MIYMLYTIYIIYTVYRTGRILPRHSKNGVIIFFRASTTVYQIRLKPGFGAASGWLSGSAPARLQPRPRPALARLRSSIRAPLTRLLTGSGSASHRFWTRPASPPRRLHPRPARSRVMAGPRSARPTPGFGPASARSQPWILIAAPARLRTAFSVARLWTALNAAASRISAGLRPVRVRLAFISNNRLCTGLNAACKRLRLHVPYLRPAVPAWRMRCEQ